MSSGKRGSASHYPDLSDLDVTLDYLPSANKPHPRQFRPEGMTEVPLNDLPVSKRPSTSPSSAGSDITSSTVPLSPNAARRLNERRPTLTDMRQQLSDVTNGAGRAIAAGAKQGLKTLTEPMEMSTFGWFDILTALISIVMFYFDCISDSLLAFYMYSDEATQEWFFITLMFLIIPLIVVNGFSLYWYWFDEHVCEADGMCYRSPKVTPYVWTFRIIAHLLLQANTLRYLDLLYYGRKSVHSSQCSPEVLESQQRNQKNSCHNQSDKTNDPSDGHSAITPAPVVTPEPSYQKLWIHAERDAANVDILASLAQDAPQLILQLYIMSHTIPDQALQGEISNTLIVQLMSVCASLVAMAWSVGSFSRATRLAEPSLGNLSPAGLLVISLAHFCCIGPQVLCFALFSTKYVIIFVIVVSCHWLAASVLILFTLVCCPNPIRMSATFTHNMQHGPCHRLDDVFFSAAFGMILLYTFVDVGGRSPKIQGGVFHVLRLLEEACMITFWYLATDGEMWYHWLPPVLVLSFFVLSLIFGSIYFFSIYPDNRQSQKSA